MGCVPRQNVPRTGVCGTLQAYRASTHSLIEVWATSMLLIKVSIQRPFFKKEGLFIGINHCLPPLVEMAWPPDRNKCLDERRIRGCAVTKRKAEIWKARQGIDKGVKGGSTGLADSLSPS